MKNIIKLLSFYLFIFLMLGCTGDFEDTNTNPNQPLETATSFLLTSAQKLMMDHTWDEWFNGRRGNQLAQYWSSNQYSSESRYRFRVEISNTYWRVFYAEALNDLQQIINFNNEDAAKYVFFGDTQNQIAVARIMKVWLYQNLTDTWGPIPYSQALQGSTNPEPIYDTQETIYRGLLTELTEAAAQINTEGEGVQGDIIYNGDMNKWKKFAHSLKLRVAIRIADVLPDLSAQSIQQAIDGGIFEGNGDNALFSYLGGAPNNNPLNEDHKTRNDFAASNTMVDVLKELGDPRIGEFYAPTVNTGEFVGEVYGLTEEDAALTPNDDVSQRSAKILAANFPGIYLDYAQTQFILAEAVERGFIGGDAASYYNEGITASMNFWGIGDAGAIDAYLAQDNVAYSSVKGASSWKEAIGKQKWIALYMQGIQGWTEWRRLDFGILQLPAGGALSGDGIPMRIIYPTDEQTLNGVSYSDGVGLLGGADALSTRLWWDVN